MIYERSYYLMAASYICWIVTDLQDLIKNKAWSATNFRMAFACPETSTEALLARGLGVKPVAKVTFEVLSYAWIRPLRR